MNSDSSSSRFTHRRSGDRRRGRPYPDRSAGSGSSHRPHGVDRLHRRPGLAQCAGLPYGPIELDPSATCCTTRRDLRGTQGLSVGRRVDRVVSAGANAARLQSSARRLAIPELPEELFVESLRQLIAVDGAWVSPAGGEESLYLRPFVFATEPGLGVRPAKQYRYLVIASPAGAYFPRGIKPVSVWLSTEYVRAAPGGTGAAEVRRQLRRLAAGAGRGRRQRLRPGGVAGRRRASLRRGDGRHEPVLRVRQCRVGPAGHARAHRHTAAGHHP